MGNLKIDKETAKKIYPTAIAEIKIILEQSFGKGFFSENIMDRVKSVEDAISVLGDSHEEVIKLNKLIRTLGVDNIIITQRLVIVREVLNEGWKANWTDSNEEKHFPLYHFKGNKFAFNNSSYYNSRSYGGLYLCFKSKQLSDYFGSVAEFTELYNQSQNII